MPESSPEHIKIIADPFHQVADILKRLRQAAGSDPIFHLVLGGTELSDLPGLSAAGATPEERRKTPALDADALRRSLSHKEKVRLPASPAGITSPVVLTKACLDLFATRLEIVDAGTFIAPEESHKTVGVRPAHRAGSGQALSMEEVEHLLQEGLQAGAENHPKHPISLLAECVPGGTTTAALVLSLLLEANANLAALCSSSLVPRQSVQSGIESSQAALVHNFDKTVFLEKELLALVESRGASLKDLRQECRLNPLKAVAMAGDPMQAYAAAYLLKRSQSGLVIAAGGSQMLAVYQLARLLAGEEKILARYFSGNFDAAIFQKNCLVATTSYVAFDRAARIPELASLCQAPLVSVDPGLKKSCHSGLRAYEHGHVKEGVGAGAACLLACTMGKLEQDQLLALIDDTYKSLVQPEVLQPG
ncbi:MAG: hypothetical protein HY986_13750 [Candidatus Melainabacteria bacterium]|nr:hypothetical protein [Candidatus Melainabacteria bacterium]